MNGGIEILTNEKKAMIQRRLNDTIPIETPGIWYHEDVPVLLQALDIAENNYAHEAEQAVNFGTHMREVADNYMIDRDRWKARVEALERAILNRKGICGTCVNLSIGMQYEKEPCISCNGTSKWQFDQVQFDKKTCNKSTD